MKRRKLTFLEQAQEFAKFYWTINDSEGLHREVRKRVTLELACACHVGPEVLRLLERERTHRAAVDAARHAARRKGE